MDGRRLDVAIEGRRKPLVVQSLMYVGPGQHGGREQERKNDGINDKHCE